MMRDDRPEGRHRRPGTRCVVWAVCEFPGELPVRLPATEITLNGARILAMKAPAIGTALRVALRPPSQDGHLVLDARVIAARLDPAAPELCYFEVLFADLDASTVDRLEALCTTPSPRLLQQRAHASQVERREYPRVDTELKALLELDGGPRTWTVRNISMSGALLDAGPEPPPPDVRPGAMVQLTLFDSNGSESVSLAAQIVRMGGATHPAGIGLNFVQVEAHTARRLEGLIVYALVKSAWPDLYRLPGRSDARLGAAPERTH
jgi:hypothetical protein